jgi:hypothetical protein
MNSGGPPGMSPYARTGDMANLCRITVYNL